MLHAADAHHLLLVPHPVHVCAVGHDFALHLLVLCIFEQLLVLAGAALAAAAESEDDDG